MQLKYIFKTIILFFIISGITAQQTPAPVQSQSILITGANIHTGTGKLIKNGAIGFEHGIITFIGAENIPTHFDQIIKVDGSEIYPGFIAPNTQLGLREISAVRSSNDYIEVEKYNPSVRSIIAYNTDSKVTPTVRSNGILIAEIAPTGRVISGVSSVVQLDAWNWEDAVIAFDMGMHIQWPARLRRTSGRGEARRTKAIDTYRKQIQDLESFFLDAKSYCSSSQLSEPNLKLEACRNLFDHQAKMFVHTQDAHSIIEAVLMAEKINVDIAIVGAAESYLILDFLKEHKVPVIISKIQRLPKHDYSNIDQPYRLAAQLDDAGILFAIGDEGYWQQRNLNFQAGQAVSYGLSYESAIKSLTLYTAKILGIDKHLGSLELGKDATLFVSEGDALDMRTCKISDAYIQGRKIDIDNKQKALNRKYRAKYGIN